MIISEIFYGVKCNRCGETCDDGDYSFHSDESSAIENAESYDWRELNGKHYCPGCHEIDEETDEVKPFAEWPKHLKTLNGFIERIVGGRKSVNEYQDHFLVKCNFYHRPKLEPFESDYIKSLLGENFISLEYEEGKHGSVTCFINIKKQTPAA